MKRYLTHTKVLNLAEKEAEIRIWGEITDQKYEEDDDAITMREFAEALDSVPENAKGITLHINTPGGACDQGNVICSMIEDRKKKCGAYFTGVNDGMIASMGTPIFAMCDRRIGRKNSLFMIHKPSMFMFGGANADDLRGAATMLDAWEDAIVAIYMNVWKGTEDELREKIRQTSWIKPADALAYGFYTEIEGENDVTADAGHYCVNGLFVPKDMLDAEGLFDISDKGGENGMIFNEEQEEAVVALFGENCGDAVLAVLGALHGANVCSAEGFKAVMENATGMETELGTVKGDLENERAAHATDLEKLGAANTQVEELTGKLAQAATKCAAYDKVRAGAVAACKASGVKAMGEAFDEKAYDNILAALDLDAVNAMAKQFEATAAVTLKAGVHAGKQEPEKGRVCDPKDYDV